jgi:DNA-binding transcriptional ArsR family regulator
MTRWGRAVAQSDVVWLDGCETRVVDAPRVHATRERLLPTGEGERLAALFRLLGDPTRVRLMYALLEAGELCVCDLAATIGAAESTVSQALRLLRTAGVVTSRRAGRMQYYRLSDGHVRMLLDVSHEHMHDERGAGS